MADPPLPRRVAAALRYRQEADRAPRVVATGRGVVADRILALAAEHGVEVRPDGALVQLLLQVPVGQEIPAEFYGVVAEILVAIYRAEREAAGR
ncbi:MAG TPA: EscU/YscU/HrcU family type III secretion system export apparatus switch protein [bacterium]|nr:EscU/YscU/HrcU family type III secretion system export apparatus switch protein [bacterium]